jgi:hypothetical protein
MRAAPASRVPAPEPSAGSDVAAAVRVVGVADGLPDAEPDAVAGADVVAVALGEGVPDADLVAPGVVAPGVVAPGVVAPGATPSAADVDADVGFGTVVDVVAEAVFFGVDVAFGLVVVGAGALVALGAGGATRGCWPDPKRNPTTVPGAGSWLATPLEL